MARAFHLISLAPNLAESVFVTPQGRTEQYLAELDRRGAAQPLPFSPRSLGRLLDRIGRTNRPIVLVLANKVVSFRKLQFPFNHPRRIVEALDFELENELLGRLDQHVYSYKIHPQAGQSAFVMAYLIERTVLDALLETCAQHQVSPHKITFSAHALYQAAPIESPLHFQFYVGADETFVSMVQANRLQSVKTFPFNPIERILTGTEGETRSPGEFLRLLDRRREPGAGSASQDTPGDSASARERRRGEESASEPMLYLYRFRSDLEGIAADLNQFLRLHALNEPVTFSAHGLFAPFLEWDADARAVRLKPESPRSPLPKREAMGVLEELRSHAEELASPGVIGFLRRRAGWWQALADYRRPLAVMATTLVLLAFLALSNLYLGLAGIRDGLEQARSELSAALQAELRSAPASPAAGLQALRQRVEEARSGLNAGSRFLDYDHDVMEMLKEVSALIADHPGLTVESLSYNPERFALAGKTPSYNESDSLRARLAELERFKGREAKITHQRTAQDITFRVSIDK